MVWSKLEKIPKDTWKGISTKVRLDVTCTNEMMKALLSQWVFSRGTLVTSISYTLPGYINGDLSYQYFVYPELVTAVQIEWP